MLGIWIKIEKSSAGKRSTYIHISRWHTICFGALYSLTVSRCHRCRSRPRWNRSWWRRMCAFAPPARQWILCCAILPREAAVRLIFPNHCQVSFYRMVHHVMQGKHNTLRLLFLNLSARFFDQLLVVLATVPGYPASVRVRPELRALVRVTNRHATRPADSWWAKPGPIPVDPWISSGFARPVGSNLPFCISGFTFMVAFRYATENRKILIMVHHGSFSMHWPLLRST